MKSSPFSLHALAVCLLILFTVLSCHKPAPEPEPDAVPLPTELKSYTLFQPGTYWLYQDSVSQQFDSVFVVSTEMSVTRIGMSYSDRVDLKYEDFHLRTRSKQGGVDQVYNVRRNCALPIRDDMTKSAYPCWAIMRGQYLPNSTADEGSTEVFPYLIPRDKAGFLNGNNAVMYSYWHTKSLLIGRQAYENVMEIKLTADASEGGWPAHYYWAPGKGIVRQRVKVGGVLHTRTLVRSRIVQ